MCVTLGGKMLLLLEVVALDKEGLQRKAGELKHCAHWAQSRQSRAKQAKELLALGSRLHESRGPSLESEVQGQGLAHASNRMPCVEAAWGAWEDGGYARTFESL